MAAAPGIEVVRAGHSVYFSPLADIIDSLAKADREGQLRDRIGGEKSAIATSAAL